MNKPAYVKLSRLKLSKILMYQFSFDYLRPVNGENAKLCYMDTFSFIVHVKIDDIYKGIAENVKTRFQTSNFELKRSLPKRKKKKVFH